MTSMSNEQTYDEKKAAEIVARLTQEQAALSQGTSVEVAKLLVHDPLLVDLSKDYPLPQYTLSYHGVGIMPLGTISLVSGKAKNGKTFALSILAAELLGANSFGFRSLLPAQRVVYFDTEQDVNDTAQVQRRDHQLLNWPTDSNHDGLFFFSMRQLDAAKVLCEIELRLQAYKPTVAFLDGVVDACEDFNGLPESSATVREICQMASKYRCHICCVLHENKSDNNARGHLGSMLTQKANDVFHVTKDKERVTVQQTEARGHRNMDDFAFSISDDGLPYPTSTPKEDKEQDRRNTVARLMKAVFGADRVLGTCEISRRYVEAVKADENLKDISSQTVMRDRIPYAEKRGLIEKTPGGKYRCIAL